MTRPTRFDIEIDGDGEATITFPEGPGQQRNAGRVAKFTEKLAKLLGRIKERHIGKHHQHINQKGTSIEERN